VRCRNDARAIAVVAVDEDLLELADDIGHAARLAPAVPRPARSALRYTTDAQSLTDRSQANARAA
jgi:hypothetical protein